MNTRFLMLTLRGIVGIEGVAVRCSVLQCVDSDMNTHSLTSSARGTGSVVRVAVR